MKKLTATFFMGLLITVLATPSFAHSWGRGPDGWGGGRGFGYHARGSFPGTAGIDLTAEQEGKIRSLREAYLKEVTSLKNEKFSKTGEMRLLWNDQNPDLEKVTALRKEISRLRSQIQDKRFDYRLESFKVLTPEQREKLKAQGRSFGIAPKRSFDRDLQRGPRRGYSPDFGRGPRMGYDQDYGRGFGPGKGYGAGYGRGPHMGYGQDYGRGFGPRDGSGPFCGPGFGPGGN